MSEVRRFTAGGLDEARAAGHTGHWLTWRRRHQARSRWFHPGPAKPELCAGQL